MSWMRGLIFGVPAVLLVLDLLAIGYILLRKIRTQRMAFRSRHIAVEFVNLFPTLKNGDIIRRYRTAPDRRMLLDQYVETRQSLHLDSAPDRRIRNVFALMGFVNRFSKRLGSPFRVSRIEAAVYLGHIGGRRARLALERQLLREKSRLAKIYIAYALSEINDPDSIMPLVESLVGAPGWYQKKVRPFILDFGSALNSVIPALMLRPQKEIRMLLILFVDNCTRGPLLAYAKKCSWMMIQTSVVLRPAP